MKSITDLSPELQALHAEAVRLEAWKDQDYHRRDGVPWLCVNIERQYIFQVMREKFDAEWCAYEDRFTSNSSSNATALNQFISEFCAKYGVTPHEVEIEPGIQYGDCAVLRLETEILIEDEALLRDMIAKRRVTITNDLHEKLLEIERMKEMLETQLKTQLEKDADQ
jgi:hypothetical protein